MVKLCGNNSRGEKKKTCRGLNINLNTEINDNVNEKKMYDMSVDDCNTVKLNNRSVFWRHSWHSTCVHLRNTKIQQKNLLGVTGRSLDNMLGIKDDR